MYKMLNNIKINGILIASFKKSNSTKNSTIIFHMEDGTILTSKNVNRKTKIYIQCIISKQWIERTYNEKFLYNKEYISPSASTAGNRNGMYGTTMTDEHKNMLRNINTGNTYRTGVPHTPETKKKISKKVAGKNNPFYGRHHTDESKNRMRKSKKGTNIGINNPFYGKTHSQKTLQQISKTKIKNGNKIPPSKKDPWIKYCEDINLLTDKNYVKHFYRINPTKLLRGNEYHLDHIYSKRDGFLNSVSVKNLCHWTNLRIISAHDNLTKSGRSDKNLDKLYKDIKRNTSQK